MLTSDDLPLISVRFLSFFVPSVRDKYNTMLHFIFLALDKNCPLYNMVKCVKGADYVVKLEL